jgi:hypothetical protein
MEGLHWFSVEGGEFTVNLGAMRPIGGPGKITQVGGDVFALEVPFGRGEKFRRTYFRVTDGANTVFVTALPRDTPRLRAALVENGFKVTAERVRLKWHLPGLVIPAVGVWPAARELGWIPGVGAAGA